MLQELLENQQTIKNKNIYLLFGMAFIALLIIVFATYAFIQLPSNKIYYNVTIAGIKIGGLDKSQALKRLKEHYEDNKLQKIILKCDNNENTFYFNDFGVSHDIEDAVEEAFLVGREQFFDKIKILFIKKDIKVSINYNKQKLEEIIDSMQMDSYVRPIEDSFEIEDDKLIFKYGKDGNGIDIKDAIRMVEERFQTGIGGTVVMVSRVIVPKQFDLDSISEVPKDASYEINEKGEALFTKEEYGISIDKEQFAVLIKQNSLNKTNFMIPAKITKPEITAKEIEEKLFRDVLGTFQTNYSTSSSNRKENIRLATSKINGVILKPGQEFSYNDIVGPRTPEAGFKMAHVYSNGQVVDGYGGGICQTSSTLYNSVLKAQLEVVSRENHMFTVGYVPLGMDATVSYGSVDFKFKNNLDWPIKIVGFADLNNVKFEILGTKVPTNQIYEYRTAVIRQTPFEVEEIEDSEMDLGATKVIQSGSPGYNVNVYRITKIDGKAVGEELIYKDSYWPLKQIKRVGTKGSKVENLDEIINIDDEILSVPVQNEEEYMIELE